MCDVQQNVILNTDSYKLSMPKQYPPGTQIVYSYIESRGGVFPQTLFFGLQVFLQALAKPITSSDIDEAREILSEHGIPFYETGWRYILEKHHGFLPLHIDAVYEGSIVPVNNVLAVVYNTDPECYWLTTHIETALLRAIWYPTTVATLSLHARMKIMHYLQLTGDPSTIEFKLHDFGFRGVSSYESAELGGMAHLVCHSGSDTLAAILKAKKCYSSSMAGFSIPAAEHSTIVSWGKMCEGEAYQNLVDKFAQSGRMFSVVSDSYDIIGATKKYWCGELRDKVISSGATLVIRPDSGDPCVLIPQLLEILGDSYGFSINTKGYRLLKHVRLIQGDGITLNTLEDILKAVVESGWSADNVNFGMGGALLQHVHRDTQKFAMKCSAVMINDVWQPVQKDPVTDSGKRSKPGRVALYRNSADEYITTTVEDAEIKHYSSAMHAVYHNGVTLNTTTFMDIRARVRAFTQ